MINFEVKLRVTWIKYYVLAATGVDNTNADPNNIIFTIKDTKFCVPAVNVSAKKHRNFKTSWQKRSMYWSEYKTKSENKNTANEYRYFLESKFVEVDRLFVLIYSK